MKLSTKAFLLSAFAYPGIGHFYLKCYIRSAIFVFIASLGFYFMITIAFEIALNIANDIERGKVKLDILAIRQLIYSSLMAFEAPQFTQAKWAIITSWVLSSADAFRVGYFQEKTRKE